MKRIILGSVITLALGSLLAMGQDDKFTERARGNRYELGVQNERLTGSGAPVLENAIHDARFVLIGEAHGIAQIPQFAEAVCGITGPLGFHTMAIETGPLAAAELERWIARPAGRAEIAAFEKKFPESIAFYDFQEEYDLLSHCSRAAQGGKFRLWGLDQELMGSSGYILTRILATHPGKEAAAAVEELLKKSDAARAEAAKDGNPEKLFMLSAGDAELAKVKDLLKREGDLTAQLLFQALLKSRDIYQKNMNGSGFDSNRERALLMKSGLAVNYAAATRADGQPPKLLLKFGGLHLTKGFNALENNDIGNYIAELADGQGATSVHILIVATGGTQLSFAGVGHPYQPVPIDPKDEDLLSLKPLTSSMNTQGWTMFDLRGLRKGFSGLGRREIDLERLVFGYDFLVLIPDATSSTQIQ